MPFIMQLQKKVLNRRLASIICGIISTMILISESQKSSLIRISRFFSAGIKTIGDGSVSGRTAWMNEPYLDSDEYGISTITDEEMESAIAFCKRYHCQLSMHAMGGKTIDRMVNRVYKEEKWTLDDTPHLRLEHITEPSDQAIEKTIEKGLLLQLSRFSSMQKLKAI